MINRTRTRIISRRVIDIQVSQGATPIRPTRQTQRLRHTIRTQQHMSTFITRTFRLSTTRRLIGQHNTPRIKFNRNFITSQQRISQRQLNQQMTFTKRITL